MAARSLRIDVERNGNLVPYISGSLAERPNFASRLTLELPADGTVFVSPDTDEWKVYLVEVDAAMGNAPAKLATLFTGKGLETISYSQTFVPSAHGRKGDVGWALTVVIPDAHRDFAEIAVPASIARTETDTWNEWAFVAEQLGFVGAAPNTPKVAIGRIDYREGESYWSALAPYFAPFEADVYRFGDRYRPVSIYYQFAVAGRTLHKKEWNPAGYTVSRYPHVDRYRVVYSDFSADGRPSPALAANRKENETHREEPDGSKFYSWDDVCDLHEDESDPTRVTRTVNVGSGRSRSKGGVALFEETVEYKWADDYTRSLGSETVVKLYVQLPYASPASLTEVERTTEKWDWHQDAAVPGRWILDEVRRVRNGLYVYTFDPDDAANGFPVKKASATPVYDSNRNGTIDTAASTSQAWDSGDITIFTERYNRTSGAGAMRVEWDEFDCLRDVEIGSGTRPQIGDNALFPGGRDRFWFVPTDPTGHVAADLDARLIGLDVGVELANLKLRFTARDRGGLRLDLMRPNPWDYGLGCGFLFHGDNPWSLTPAVVGVRPWNFVTEVDWKFVGLPTPTVPAVAQSITVVHVPVSPATGEP